jgi:hypothetical protein
VRVVARADFFTSLIFLALGIYMVEEGLRMPGAGGFIVRGGEPGRVPLLIGAIIALLAVALLVRAVRQGGHRARGTRPTDQDARSGTIRCAVTALVCSFYAVGLLGSSIAGYEIQYDQATFLFLAVFIIGSEWSFAPELAAMRRERWTRRAPRLTRLAQGMLGFVPAAYAPYVWLIVLALVQAALVAWTVGYVFENEFYVKLP